MTAYQMVWLLVFVAGATHAITVSIANKKRAKAVDAAFTFGRDSFREEIATIRGRVEHQCLALAGPIIMGNGCHLTIHHGLIIGSDKAIHIDGSNNVVDRCSLNMVSDPGTLTAYSKEEVQRAHKILTDIKLIVERNEV